MKRLPNYSLLWVSFIVFLCTGCNPASQLSVSSPDGNLCLHVETENGKLYYELSRNGKPILDKSRLGFILKEDTLAGHLEITEALHHSFSGTWEQIWGEDRIVENNYHEMTIRVQKTSAPKRKFNVVFRLFNDGFGFRYEFPEQEALKDFVIMDELTEFALTGDHKAWSIPYETHFYEALYEASPVSKLGWVSTPLTMETNDGLFLSIHEANLTDYAAMNLIPKEGSMTLKANLTPWSTGEKVFMKAPRVTPWRTMIVAESAGDLLLSRLMLNLNEPCRIQDTSWIQPGRYIGIWWTYHMHKHTWHTGPRHGATTANALRHIDFAARHGFQGVLIEGWNKGWDTYHFNFTEPYPDFDLKQITDYAASKGVTLIGHHETDGWVSDYENQLEAAFNLYKDHGVQIVNSGRAGSDPEIRIRGTNSINGYKPLYIVDGLFNDNINFLNPEDIESMEILKDPSSLAIFGVRGANGVIIITTKKAKEGQTLVNINTSFGFKKVVDKVKLVNGSQFRELYSEQLANQEDAPFDFTGWNANTDWQDEIFQTAFITNNNISITGASPKHSFYLGVGYSYEQGNIEHEKFSKVTINASNDYKITDYLKVGFQFNGARMLPADSKQVLNALRATPIAPVYNDEYGLYSALPEFQKAQINNPMVDVSLRANTTKAENYRASGNIYGEVDFLKHFNFKAMFSMDYASNNGLCLYT